MTKSDFKRCFFKNISCFILLIALFFYSPSIAEAKLEITYQDGNSVKRSLESLRDLDYQTWQVVAYPNYEETGFIILRIVGYPGSLRLNHPSTLIIRSGIKKWELKDITLDNYKLSNDAREAAAEFNLEPLLLDLTQNRPLRLFLKGAFNELPVPPYIVKEWRSLQIERQKHE